MNMAEIEEIYNLQYKQARQSWNYKMNQGISGHVPSLDSIIQHGEVLSEVPLGTIEIPLIKVVGTYTRSRSTSFAADFKPLMKTDTEFAYKWMNLYNAHIEEGLRDPIKVYEYFNKFYVMEGNKRVSVLKCVNAVSYSAQVIRLIPKRDKTDKLNNIYYEFLDFYRETQVNAIWFSQEGKFEELLEYINRYIQAYDLQNDEDRYKIFVRELFTPFCTIYKEAGECRLVDITVGDAFLSYLKIHTLTKCIDIDDKMSIVNFIKELAIIHQDQANVQTTPLEAPKKSVFSSFTDSLTGLLSPKKTLKIAFVYAKTPKTSGWVYGHELGRLHLINIFHDEIHTTTVENVPENQSAYEYLVSLAQANYDVVFTTSPTFVAPALRVALEYPNVKFFNCASTHSYKSLTLYYGRIHEARYILGMVAGAMTKNNILGYVAPYPISQIISSVNAFTLGAKSVNPNVTVKALWTNRWDNPELGRKVASELLEYGVDIISNEDLPIAGDMSKEYGIYSVDKNTLEKTHYAMAIWNWGVFYEKVIRNILSGTWKTVYETGNNTPTNFWLGMDTGIVDILYSNRNINPQMKNLIECVKYGITSNEFNIFKGPIYDTIGNLRVPIGATCDYEQIINMDWFVAGVEATLPDTSQLTPVDPFSYMQDVVNQNPA
ncbi:MAG: hypothetical protein BEN18_00825 [Epulopiscium sp. Nuni2H_MBin001]|nr:MAG: hypothetical protein BEN18_00825 [Epulopiscium sp. Nuni2H_MBin001]